MFKNGKNGSNIEKIAQISSHFFNSVVLYIKI